MAYLINKMENEIIEENQEVTEIKEEENQEEEVFDITTRPDTKFKQGYLTQDGVELEDGSIAIKRQKAKKYADLSNEENDTLERWTKQACRDYPDADPWWMESIAYYCLTKSEEAKKYAEDNQDKLYQTAKQERQCWERIEKENPHVKRDVKFCNDLAN